VTKLGTEQEPIMLQFPHVVMRSSHDRLIDDANTLFKLLEAHGVSFDHDPEHDRFPGIEASYSPVDEVATIMLTDIDDKTLEGSSC